MNAPVTMQDLALELGATAGRIMAAVHDAQQTGDTDAADTIIRRALPELRRVVDAIEGAYSDATSATTHQPLHVLEVDNSGVEIARFDYPVMNGVAVDLLRVLVNESVTPGRAASMLRQLADTVERCGFLYRPGDQQTAEEHQEPPPDWNPADADELTLTMRGRVPDDFSGPDPFGEAQRREARLEAEGFRQWREREDAIAGLVAVRRQQQGGGES